MPLIQWSDALSVRVTAIDEQHKNLVRMLNELHGAMTQKRGKEVIGIIIASLIEYAATHFKTEEDYFDRFRYPDTEPHKQEHAAFVSKVKQFKKEYDEGAIALSVEVLHFLSNWLQNHIKGTDKKYSDFLNDKGLK